MQKRKQRAFDPKPAPECLRKQPFSLFVAHTGNSKEGPVPIERSHIQKIPMVIELRLFPQNTVVQQTSDNRLIHPFAQAPREHFVRAPKTEDQRPILDWVREIAKCAATMTQTRMEEELLSSCYEFLLNDPLSEMLYRNFKQVGPAKFSPSDWEFAGKLATGFDKEPKVLLDTALTELKIVPPDKWIWGSGSVDDGDVSWVVPYGRIETPCAVEGGNWHHWHVVACAGMDIGFTGMTTAARVLAGAGVEVLLNEKLRQAAWEDFNKKLDGRKYECGVPPGVRPPHSRPGQANYTAK